MSTQVAEEQKAPEQVKESMAAEELLARMERLEKSNQRLLDESKTWKAKYQSIKSESEEKQTQQMQEANDFKGLYEKTLEKAKSLEEAIKLEKKTALENTLKYEVAKNAKDAEDTDLLLAAIKLKKKDLLGYDSDNGLWKGVDLAIDELRVSNPGLFVKDKPTMINGRPQSAVTKEKTMDELILENPNSVLNSVLSELLK